MKKLLSLLLLFFSSFAFSQTNQWTWVSGDNIPDQPGVYGTKSISSPTNKPGARHGAVSWTDAAGNLWLFGGRGYASNGNGLLNDLWKFDPSTGEWTWMSGDNTVGQPGNYGTKGIPSPTNKPGCREGAVSWIGKDGNLWLFGGLGLAANSTNGVGELNDLWRYNTATNEWTWVSGDNIPDQLGVYGTKGVPSPANKPGAREDAVSWTDAKGNLWLFGGSRFARVVTFEHNDLWKYDITTNQWTWVSGDNVPFEPNVYGNVGIYGTKGVPSPDNKPGRRGGAVGWIDTQDNLWLFGGFTTNTTYSFNRFNDLWRYNTATNEWTWMSGDSTADQRGNTGFDGVYGTKGSASPSNKPGAREFAESWSDAQGHFWLFGGNGRAANATGLLNDLWKYNPFTGEWTWVSGDNTPNQPGVYGTKGIAGADNKPGARQEAVSWNDARNNLWLFGGTGYATSGNVGQLNDLWRYSIPQTLTFFMVARFTGESASVCAGSTIPVSWVSNGIFNANNVLTAYFYSALPGGEANKIVIGTLTASFANSMQVTIPANTPAGPYRIQVESSSPSRVGGAALIVRPLPTATITAADSYTSPGLTYKYYEGNWTSLPDFGGITPVASGTTANVSLAPRKRDEHFAFLWEGQITVPAAGTYYFETESDDGSRVYIGEYSHFATPVVNNDGLHAAQRAGGSYWFPAAGTYPIAITYFEATGAETMKLYWTSAEAGIPIRTPIPDAAFSHLNYSPSSAGLTYKYYEGSWTKLPDFGGLTPVATGTVGGVDLSPKKRSEHFAFLWEGRIFIPKAGTYRFETRSDDGSKLYIGNYGHYITQVVDNDGLHPMQAASGSYTFPAAGMYPIAISFFEATGGEGIELYWSSADAGIPTGTRIPNSAFREVLGSEGCSPAGVTLTASEGDSYLWSTGETTRSIIAKQNGRYTVTVTKDGCSATSAPAVVTCIDNSITQSSSFSKGGIAPQGVSITGQLSIKVLPNPSPSQFTLQVGAAAGERVTIRIMDMLGRIVETKTTAANTSVQVGSTYRPGTYLVQVVQGGEKVTLKLVKTAGF